MTHDEMMQAAWNYCWDKLFHPGMNLFYDGLTDHPTDPLCGYLPTPEEIALHFPNCCSWNTGMEDSMLNGGPALLMLIERWEATNDVSLREYAAKVFEGMRRCATISGKPGFLARSISPVDKKSFFINSSRDQYTLFIYAWWKFFRSSLSTDAQKQEIRTILCDIARRCEKFVTPETNYELPRVDDRSGMVCQMWGHGTEEHEILRLPMFYAAAWSVSGDKHWRDLYLPFLREGLPFAAKITRHPWFPAFALLQMQYSQRLLWEVEEEGALKDALCDVLHTTAQISMRSLDEFDRLYRKLHGFLGHRNGDWRKRPFAYLDEKPCHGIVYVKPLPTDEFRETLCAVREIGEGMLIKLLAPGFAISPAEKLRFSAAARKIDYEFHHTYAPIHILAACWGLKNAEKENA